MRKHAGWMTAMGTVWLLGCAEEGARAADEAPPTLDAWVAAYNRGDLDALVAEYAPDAILLPPGGTVLSGHDAVREVFAGTISREGVRLQPIGSWADAGVATEIGTWEHFTRVTHAVTSAGTYSVIWRRDEGGAWRIVMNGYAARADVPDPEAER